MQIYVHTDNNVDGTAEMTTYVEGEVRTALTRFSDHLTRVEVHFSDESAGRVTESDTRCIFEARPEGQPPVAVTDNADSVDAALEGALRRLDHLLTSQEGKQQAQHGRASIRGNADE
jgi:ribosome-associated translation inhibitor RaiA